MTLLVAPVSVQAARYAVEHWHYSRRMPMPPLVCYGVWEDRRYVGAVLFGRGGNRRLLRPYGLDVIEGAELVRVTLRDHSAPVSQLVAAAVKRLKASSPRLRLLVSYADPSYGHHGGIYQAMGWTYVGQTPPDRCFIDPATGRRYHTRVVTPSGWARQFGKLTRVQRPDDLQLVRLPGKHKYLLPLDRAMRRQVAKLARPYPQPCGRGVDGDAPVPRTGGAGSTPADRSDERGAA